MFQIKKFHINCVSPVGSRGLKKKKNRVRQGGVGFMRIKGKAVTSVSIERDQTRPGQRQQRVSDQTRAWVSRLVNVDADVDPQLWGPPTPAPPTILSPLTPSIDTWLFPRALLGLQSPSSLTCGSPLHVATTPLPRVSLFLKGHSFWRKWGEGGE